MTMKGQGMEYRRPKDEPEAHCCNITCTEPAKWRLYIGPTVDDVTDACGAHVAELIGDATVEHVEPLYPLGKAFIDVMLDGPPGPVSGRFVDCVAFRDNDVSHQGPKTARGVSAGEWVEVGNYWHLRIPVPSGWLVG